MSKSRPTAAVIIPALNEADNIGPLVDDLREVVETGGFPVEVVAIRVVDNGSTDDTAGVAIAAGARVVREPVPGYGRACYAGALASDDAEILIFMDGDRGESPAEMARLLAPLLANRADLVVGSRVLGNAEPGALTTPQRMGNAVATRVIGVLSGARITDLGPYRAIRRDQLLALGMREMTYGWPTEMIARAAHAGLRVQEVPVSCRRRVAGVSKVSGNLRASLRTCWRVFATIVTVRRLPAAAPGAGVGQG